MLFSEVFCPFLRIMDNKMLENVFLIENEMKALSKMQEQKEICYFFELNM
jgi:hypothetical protein